MISKILKILVNSTFIFFRPTKKKVIIYDNNYSELLVSYFKSYDILYTRFEKINIFILLKSFFINGFKNIHFNYKKTYINFVNPDLLITFTDNDLDFLQFKFKKIKKIAIQGAYRRETFPDLFSILKYEKKKKKYNLDHIFCYGKSIGEYYQKYLNCTYTSIGSFKNNLFSIKEKKIERSILFISQYRDVHTQKTKEYFFEYNDFKKFLSKTNFKKNQFTNLSRQDFYSHDKNIFRCLYLYSKEKNYKLFVLGEAKKNYQNEINFYKSISGNKFYYLMRRSKLDSYRKLDKFTVVTGIDSTMLYEALSRDNKVIFFSGRRSSFKENHGYFGWPYNESQLGSFWTNKDDKKSIFKILDNVIKQRNLKKEQFNDNLILYDYKNSIFTNYLKKNCI